jgi:hypothetical protein
MSSALMTVVLAGRRRASSENRVALTTIASSCWENAGVAKAAVKAAAAKARRIRIPSGVVPDATTKVKERSKAGLRTREWWLAPPGARLPVN